MIKINNLVTNIKWLGVCNSIHQYSLSIPAISRPFLAREDAVCWRICAAAWLLWLHRASSHRTFSWGTGAVSQRHHPGRDSPMICNILRRTDPLVESRILGLSTDTFYGKFPKAVHQSLDNRSRVRLRRRRMGKPNLVWWQSDFHLDSVQKVNEES